MCLELKAKHTYSEMNDNIIKALSIHCIMIQLAFFTRKKKIKDTKAINYQIYITFNNCIFSWARLWQILVLKKREKKKIDLQDMHAFFFHMYWPYIIDDARKLLSRKSATVFREIFTPVLFSPLLLRANLRLGKFHCHK